MQPPDDRPQTAFQHPMKLEGLARRDTQGVAAMCASKFVELQPLCRAAHSTRQTHPDHELISGFQLLAAAFVAQIAVILLIYPVELHQLDIVAGGHCSGDPRSEEHTSELQSLMRISYAVFCLKKKT